MLPALVRAQPAGAAAPEPAAPAPADSLPARSLAEAFGRGHWHGRVRNDFLATVNQGNLPDYYANGLGAGVRFETALLHGFQLGAGGFFWANLASSDLATPDAATGAVNRYEAGLFDVTDPGRRQLTGRPEELYVRYRRRHSSATFGRQLLSTPLLNPYDGRLTPSYAQGLWLEIGELPRTTVTAGWLTHMGPRSTTAWYSVANSIGVYPSGVSETGQRSAYAGNLRSRGVGVLAVSRQLGERTRAQVWNYYADNLFNTVFSEITTSRDAGAGQLTLGGQFLYQRTVGTGGNADPRLAFSVPGHQAQALSARLGYQLGAWRVSGNYTRITRAGRFLFPREWGREPFYAFMPRERDEGAGGLDAAVLLASYAVPAAPGLTAEVGYGRYYLPDVRNTRLNKYGMPSYQQLNASLTYPFRGGASGLKWQLLYVYKGALGNTYGEARYLINKVDMHLLNVVVNYAF